MTQVTMKALDTLHISNASADNLVAGDVFTVSEAEAIDLERRGLAERGGSASKAVNAAAAATDRPDTREALDAERGGGSATVIGAPAAKKERAPTNKNAGPAPANKAARPPRARKGK